MANGWNNSTWGALGWSGLQSSTVLITGQQLNISQNSITATPVSLISITGLQLNTSLDSVQAFGLAIVDVTGQQLNISQGTADAEPDAIVTGQQLNISLNSVTTIVEINSGWGRRGWGIFDWGSDGLSITTSVTGQQINTSLNSVTPIAKPIVIPIPVTVASGLGSTSPSVTFSC